MVVGAGGPHFTLLAGQALAVSTECRSFQIIIQLLASSEKDLLKQPHVEMQVSPGYCLLHSQILEMRLIIRSHLTDSSPRFLAELLTVPKCLSPLLWLVTPSAETMSRRLFARSGQVTGHQAVIFIMRK